MPAFFLNIKDATTSAKNARDKTGGTTKCIASIRLVTKQKAIALPKNPVGNKPNFEVVLKEFFYRLHTVLILFVKWESVRF